jgi:hypothetical protein
MISMKEKKKEKKKKNKKDDWMTNHAKSLL